MAISTRLVIEDETFDVLRCQYGFSRKVDTKGRPATGVFGGEMLVELESTYNDALLELMLTDEPKSLRGSLEVWDEKEMSLVRNIEWEDAYVYSVGEELYSSSSKPMTTMLSITPLRLDINRSIRIDRRFPQTSGFYWQEFVPEKVNAVSGESADDSVTIMDAYWLDDSGNQIRDLNVEYPVTLYVVLGKYNVGSTINLTFEDIDQEDGWKRADCSGTVGDGGIVVINEFKLETVDKEQ